MLTLHEFISSVLCSVLLQAGADINAQDYDGWTALHAAVHWGQEDACQTLVDHMCDMDVKNNAVSL
jgi:ankyrin repeat protein